MYDVIIIGARCAGSPTAMLLAQKGFKVLLVDKASFPSDTISTHIIFPNGVERLKKWGLLEKVMITGCPVIRIMGLDLGVSLLKGSPPLPDGVPGIIAPRRTLLDKILVDAAVDSGSEFREQCMAEEIIFEDDRVTGVRLKSKDGTVITEKARLVIGADGRNSIVAKTVKAEQYNAVPALTCWYYTYWSGLSVEELIFYSPPRRAVGTIPTNNGLTCIPVASPANELKEFRSDIEGNYMRAIEMIPDLAAMISKGTREEKFVGMTDVPNFFRKPYGAGWALAGDAGYHKDPITGQGINDAFRDAESLSNTIEDIFTGKTSFENAFAGHQQKRDEACMAMYGFTRDWARLEEPPPDMQHLLAALLTKQDQADRFFGSIAGSIRIEDFFSQENIQNIFASSESK